MIAADRIVAVRLAVACMDCHSNSVLLTRHEGRRGGGGCQTGRQIGQGQKDRLMDRVHAVARRLPASQCKYWNANFVAGCIKEGNKYIWPP
jgi:hypothetical protein